jgi:uncharacterized membrane protein
MSNIVPRNEVSKQGAKGVGALAGGAALIVLSLLGPVLGFITGGVLTVLGFALTGSKSDRTAGFIAAGAGLITVVSALHRFIPIFPNLSWLMWIPGIGLLAIGAVSLVRFLGNLRKRS